MLESIRQEGGSEARLGFSSVQGADSRMYLTRFIDIFREQGIAETRSFTTQGSPGLPDDEYGLIECYCTDPECDCRRVMLNVVRRTRAKRGYVASISYGFDRDDEMAGPFLDPLNPQSEYAEPLLEVVREAVLSDRAYLARLESHYQLVKRAAADPRDPAYERIRRIDHQSEQPEVPRDRGAAASATESYRLVGSLPESIAKLKRPSQPNTKSARKRRKKRR